jgi:diguanylate cyclase
VSVQRLTNEQLQNAITQLDQAIYSHDQWHKGLVRGLVAQLPPDAADLSPDAHKRCRFGQWYDSDEVGLLRENPAFVALGEAHRQMHEGATRLLRRRVDGLDVSVDEYDQFDNVLDRLRLEVHSLQRELATIAQNRDPLTDVRNRSALLTDLREQQALVRRGVQSCALVMIDLDHFKQLNDSHGHPAGDAVLRATARCLQSSLRAYDHLYRYGGEEFLVVMPQIDVEGATEVAERLRADVAAQRISNADGELGITASFGVAPLDPVQPIEDSIDRADKALYRAKNGGRNRVEHAAGPSD